MNVIAIDTTYTWSQVIPTLSSKSYSNQSKKNSYTLHLYICEKKKTNRINATIPKYSVYCKLQLVLGLRHCRPLSKGDWFCNMQRTTNKMSHFYNDRHIKLFIHKTHVSTYLFRLTKGKSNLLRQLRSRFIQLCFLSKRNEYDNIKKCKQVLFYSLFLAQHFYVGIVHSKVIQRCCYHLLTCGNDRDVTQL